MSGPWEKYKKQPEDGPWSKYATPVTESAGKEKGLIRRSAEAIIDSPALPIAGGVAGALAGAGVASIPFAGLGGAAGEAYRQLAARSLGMESPNTSFQAIKDIGIEGATQAIGEGAGSFVVAPALKAAANVLKKPAADLFQLITKIKPQYAKTLFENPESILPGAMKEAKVQWRKAAEEAGIPVDDVSPEIIDALKKDARNTVFSTFERIRGGDSVTAGEAQIAKQALDIALMPAAKTERNKPLVALYSKMRDELVRTVGKGSPDLAEANKAYAIGKAGEKFRSIFPRNLDDSPAYFRSTVLPSIFLGLGAGRGDTTEGALQAVGASALTSPIAIGSTIAGLGFGRRAGPVIGKALMSSLAELGKNKAQE